MADIPVNAMDWEKLAQGEKDKILDILRSSKLIQAGDQIVGSLAAPAVANFASSDFVAGLKAFFTDPLKQGCCAACTAAEDVGFAACNLYFKDDPFKALVCRAAVFTAGHVCRGKC